MSVEEKRGRGRPPKEDFSADTIIVNDDWQIRRFDELNWVLHYKGTMCPDPNHPWYYGTLKGAFQALADKTLSYPPVSAMRGIDDILRIMQSTREDIQKALP